MNHPIDDTLQLLQRSLSRVSKSANVTASNIANVDTPGYRAKRLVFAQTLDALQQEVPGVTPREDRAFTVEALGQRIKPDGNNVDMDIEMADLAKAQGRYTATTQMLRKRFALLRYAATNGRQ